MGVETFQELESASNVCSKLHELSEYGVITAVSNTDNILELVQFCAIKDCISEDAVPEISTYCLW